MKFNKLLLIAICFSFSVVSSCKFDDETCPGSQTYTYNLNADQKSKVPYGPHDTIVFVSNNYDTAVFVGTGIETGFLAQDGVGGKPGCPPPSVNKYEYVKYTYKPIGRNQIERLEVNIYENDLISGVASCLVYSVLNYRIIGKINRLTESYYTDTIYTNSGLNQVIKFSDIDNDNIFYNHTKGIFRFVDHQTNMTWNVLLKN